ncbi:hypothetical protein, partial [Mucilaginibacter sp.]|uniref:hypothetical protein n=1 Tax=Mucilaginibacter sp. TaxID=1882438 RepID=UPI002ED46936
WNSVFDFILSGYLDEVKLRAEFESRDPDRVPDHLVCFPLVVNYKFRHLSDDAFLINAEKTLRYAEEGLYSIYDYLQIAVFYFYFSDKGLISLDYERILISLRKGLGKAAQRGEIDDDKYRNLMHFQRDNPVAEEFKQEISMVHINIIRQQKQSIMRRINGHIREGEIDEITKLFQEHQADNNLLPAAHMEDMCQMITEAPNRSISQLAVIFEERYNAGLCQLLTDDAEPLQILDSHLDMLLLITAKGVRQFVLREFSKAIKEGIIGVNHAKKHPLKSRRSTLGTVAPGETQEE